jgi:putative ABC transport system permease protein
MPVISRARSLWNTLLHKERLDRELDDELRSAVEILAARLEREGLDRPDALRQAERQLAGPGGLIPVRAAVREGRTGAALDALIVDARHASRGLRHAPLFTGAIVATLALGIGANTAIFSVVHAMLLAPLPYPGSDRLAVVWLDRSSAAPGVGYPRGPMSGPDFQNLREGTSSFEALAGIWASGTLAFTGEEGPEQLRGAYVTTNFFDVLGVAPALGRGFAAGDSEPGAPLSLVIGWDLFQRRFGGDEAIVGRRVEVDGDFATVVGVAPRDFRLLLPPEASVPDHLQAFTPFWPDMEGGPRRNLFLRVIGRLRPDVTIAAARADVDAMATRLSEELGQPRTFVTASLQADDVREIRGPLLALFAGVAMLLAIACVNVASLLAARAAARARETALRLALGASRMRLLGQSVVEGLQLTMLGVAAGVVVGYWSLRLLLAMLPPSLSRLEMARIDGTVLAFTVSVAVVWGLLLSLAPLGEIVRA